MRDKSPEVEESPNINPGDLVLDPDDEDVWYDFKCKEKEHGEPCPLIEEVGERADCVSISPWGGFSYCPSLFIVVSGDTIKKKMKEGL